MTKGFGLSRREFLKSGARSGVGLAALGGISFMGTAQRVLGANERVRLAVCGVRGRGFDHIKGFSKIPNVDIAAICEVDENVARERMAEEGVGAVAVIEKEEKQELRGVFTERDVMLRVVLRNRPPHATRVGDVMTVPAETIHEQAGAEEALNHMLQRHNNIND